MEDMHDSVGALLTELQEELRTIEHDMNNNQSVIL